MSTGGGDADAGSRAQDLVTEAFGLDASDEAGLDAKAKEISACISRKGLSLVNFVEQLGPQLTSTVIQERVKAVDLLGRVFASFPKDFLSQKELEFVVEFLLNRLKDTHLVVPKVISCAFPIVQCQNLPKSAGARLLHQIFQEANVQSHVHKTRRTVYLMIDFMIRNKLDELLELSSDFVINFLQAMDGEKDPRNLLLLFQIIPSIITHFNLGPFVEDFFEVLSCYFPVDFSPNSGVGVAQITRDMLASALHNCLSHTSQFSPFLVPLVLEKLDSSLQDAKIDSLQLLELCCEKCYQPANLQPFLHQLWHSLRREVFMGGSEHVEKASVAFLRSAFKVVSKDEGVLNTCIELIFTECKHHLCEPELRLIQPTSKILLAMCDAGEVSCKAVAPKVLMVLHEQLIKTSVQGERKRIMEIAELILSSTRQYEQVALVDLIEKWDELIATWFSFVTSENPDFSTLALKALYQASLREADFSVKERTLLQDHLIALVKRNSLSKATISTLLKVTETLVANYGEEFSRACLPGLLNCVLETIQGEDDKNNSETNLSAKLISECSVYNSTVFRSSVSFLLETIKSNSVSSISVSRAVWCLNRLVEKVGAMPNSQTVTALNPIAVEELLAFDIIFKVLLQTWKTNQEVKMNTDENDLEEEAVLFNTGLNILRNLMRNSSESVQSKLVEKFWNDMLMAKSWDDFFSTFPFPFAEALLGPLWPSVRFHRQVEFYEHLLLQPFNDRDRSSAFRLISVFVNKIESETEYAELTMKIRGMLEERLSNVDGDPTTTGSETFRMEVDTSQGLPEITGHCQLRNSTMLLVWVTKGLAMRGERNLVSWVDKLISLLESPVVGDVAASGFEVLLGDGKGCVNPESHCKYRFLYKQRLFQMAVPKLVAGYRGSQSEMGKANFISALSSQLKHISKDVLAMEMENVFPLLVASLKLQTSPAVTSSTLKAFTEMLENSDAETDKRLVEYCYEIIPQLTLLSAFPDNMEVRVMALRLLYKCAKCPTHVILPLRKAVIDGTNKCLDDHKRLVRREARATRNAWIMVGAPGGL